MATKPAAGDYYIVSAKNTARCLDISGGSMENGANVQIFTRNNTDAQRFKLTYRKDGTLQITNYLNAKSLDIPNGSLASGHNIQMYTDNDSRAQQWDLKDYNETKTVDGTSYSVWGIFLSAASTLFMDIANGSTSPGANVRIFTGNDTDAQKWIFIPIAPFKSGGLYELRSMLKTSMCADIANGSTFDGANVWLYSANGTNAQKFAITDEGNGWSIRAVGAGKYVDVEGGSFKNGANVQTFTDNDSRAQRWAMTIYDTVSINNKTCQVVRFGAGNANTYCMDVSGGSTAVTANIQIWQANGTNAQKWALYPTNAEDPNMPSPYGVGLAETVGGTVSKFLAVTGTNKAISKKVIPSWSSADAWATKGSNSFQWRWRTRFMDSSKSVWRDWGNYTSWVPALVTRDGSRYDVTEGIDVAFALSQSKSMQIQLEIKSCGVNEYKLLTGVPVNEVLNVYYKPTVTLSNPQLTKDGLTFSYSSDYDVGTVNVFVQSLSSGSFEYLSSEYKAQLLDDATTLTIPYSHLASIPVDGSTLRMVFGVGTDQYDRFQGTSTVSGLSVTYAAHSSLPITYTDGDGYTVTATVNDVGSVRMWIVLDENLVECDRISSANGTVSFMVPYPFGSSYRIFVTGQSGSTWYMTSESKTGSRTPVHAWNFDGLSCVLECREDEVLSTEFDLESNYEQFDLNSRGWQATKFGVTKKGKFTAEGALVPGMTESTYTVFERMVGRHALFRSVTGDISKVAVLSAKRTTKKSHTVITVTMSKEEF